MNIRPGLSGIIDNETTFNQITENDIYNEYAHRKLYVMYMKIFYAKFIMRVKNCFSY